MTILANRLATELGKVCSTLWLYAAAAAPQVIGLVSQMLIIKVFFATTAAITLPAYQFALTVSSILYLGLAYQSTLIKIKVVPVLIFQVLLFGAGLLGKSKIIDPYFVNITLYLSYFIGISIVQYYILIKLNEKIYIYALSIISFISPQILWMGLSPTIILSIIVFAIFVKLNQSSSGEEYYGKEAVLRAIRSISYNIILQLHLLSLSLFDPLLVAVVGSGFYVNFVLLQKITNGLGVLAFSRIQMKIVLKQYRIREFSKFLAMFILIIVASTIAAIWGGQFALPIQCVLLSLSINLASLIIRDHLQWGRRSHFLPAAVIGAVVIYGSVVFSCFYFGWILSDILTFMIVMITAPTLLVMINSYAVMRVGAPASD